MGNRKSKIAKSGVQEWASHSENIQLGCENGCVYCYARDMAVRRFKACTAGQWANPTVHIEKINRPCRQRHGVTMFPTTHDITPANVGFVITRLMHLLTAGNRVLLVTKANPECIERICQAVWYERGCCDLLEIRVTIGTLNEGLARMLEPGAPGPQDRIQALQIVGKYEIKTSISAEPLWEQTVEGAVRMVHHFATLTDGEIWIGLCRDPDRRVQWDKLRVGVGMNNWCNLFHAWDDDEKLAALVEECKQFPQVRWKDSIRKRLGIL